MKRQGNLGHGNMLGKDGFPIALPLLGEDDFPIALPVPLLGMM
ncbi:MAG TPA: hypothetical protein VLE70_00745 [Anaerolineae bacterium]|jgi:hypothetical protein|nr:hypothetical protein [Anaerolineae bacterium]